MCHIYYNIYIFLNLLTCVKLCCHVIICHLRCFWVLFPSPSPCYFLISLMVFPLYNFATVTFRNACHVIAELTVSCSDHIYSDALHNHVRYNFSQWPEFHLASYAHVHLPLRINSSRKTFVAGQLVYTHALSLSSCCTLHVCSYQAPRSGIICLPIFPTLFWNSKEGTYLVYLFIFDTNILCMCMCT